MNLEKLNYVEEGPYTEAASRLALYSADRSNGNKIRAISNEVSSALSRETGHSFREIQARALNFTNGKCFYTGKQLVDTDGNLLVKSDDIHRDHLFPASRGGLYALGNVVMVLASANLEKSDMDPIEYYAYRLAHNQPTLYKTLNEAKAAIGFLNSIYRVYYPNASAFLDDFDNLPEKFTSSDFHSLVRVPLESELGDTLFIDMSGGGGRIASTFDKDLKNLDFWQKLKNNENVIWGTTSESSLYDYSTSRLVRVSDHFVEKGLDPLDLSENELDEILTDIILEESKGSISEKRKFNKIRKTIIILRAQELNNADKEA